MADQVTRLNDPAGNTDNMLRIAKMGGGKRTMKARKKYKTSDDEE